MALFYVVKTIAAAICKDKDFYNARRRLFKYSIHKVLRECRGLSEGSGESQTSSHLGYVLKDE